MSDFTQEELEKLTEISRIKLTPAEEELVVDNLKKILIYMDQLDEVDLEGVPTCDHVLGPMCTPLYDDEYGETMARDTLLKMTPVVDGKHSEVGGMVRVPQIMSGGDDEELA